MHDALLITGVGGVGKTTVAGAIGGFVARAGASIAVIDTDDLAQFAPGPLPLPLDRQGFYESLKCKNLAAVWTTYRAIGARFVVVSGGIETRSLSEQYAESLVDCNVQLVLLSAPLAVVSARLQGRDEGEKLERHLRNLAEGEAALRAAGIDDFTVVNDRPPSVVAQEVVERAGWVLSGPS